MKFGQWIGFVLLGLALYSLWQIRQIVLLLLTAVILATLLNLLVRRFQAWGVRRGYAVLLSVILLLATLVSVFSLIIPPFVEQVQELATLVPQGIEQLIARVGKLFTRLDANVIDALPKWQQLTQQLQPLANQIAGRGLSFFYSSLGIPLSLLLLLVLTLMILADPLAYRRGFIRFFPAFYRQRIDDILTLCDRALQEWLLIVAFNMSLITLLSLLTLLILQIPLALSQAMLAGVLTFIPNIGAGLSVIPPMAIALLEDPWKAWVVLALYILIQYATSHWITPKVLPQQISLLPGITLLAQVFFATFFGFLGLFLAFPLVVISRICFQEVLIKDMLDRWDAKK